MTHKLFYKYLLILGLGLANQLAASSKTGAPYHEHEFKYSKDDDEISSEYRNEEKTPELRHFQHQPTPPYLRLPNQISQEEITDLARVKHGLKCGLISGLGAVIAFVAYNAMMGK